MKGEWVPAVFQREASVRQGADRMLSSSLRDVGQGESSTQMTAKGLIQ